MDRFNDSNITDVCRFHGNNTIGTSFTVTPWISLRTDPSHDGVASFGYYYGNGTRMLGHHKENLMDILDEAMRIIDEVFIDFSSTPAGIPEATINAISTTSSEARESTTIHIPIDDSEIDVSNPLRKTDEISTSQFDGDMDT